MPTSAGQGLGKFRFERKRADKIIMTPRHQLRLRRITTVSLPNRPMKDIRYKSLKRDNTNWGLSDK